MDLKEKIIEELLKTKVKSKVDLDLFKRKISKKYKIPFPTNIELLKGYHEFLKKKRLKINKQIEDLLKTRKIRSLSGIVNISVLTKPYFCPGTCIFCPSEKGLPKSYLGEEPAVQRAKRLNFSPFLQVKRRIETLRMEGHPTDKIELRIVGGTFSVYPLNYRIWFLKECFRGADFEKNPLKMEKNIQKLWKELEKAQKKNEKAKNRIVGISIETRPDFIDEKEIKILRKLGVTMVEMGVQSIFDDVLTTNKTNLTQEKIVKATKLLKDAGFKILYHLMLNLPGSNFEKDFKCFKIVFSDQRFKPDWLKIYPTVVVKGSPLFKIWKEGKYRPYSEEKLIELLIKIKKNLPYWVRVARVLRDIPAKKIEAGCKISNLREVVKREMKKRNLFCKCIRCREVREKYDPKEKIYLFREDYEASDGKEIFLSFETKERKLYSFLRLRIPSKNGTFLPVLKNSAIIREIQTYGEQVPIAKRKLAPQHRGLGKKLIREAEKIAKKEFDLNKIAVIAGVGVRGYFRKLGYRLRETYMIKKI